MDTIFTRLEEASRTGDVGSLKRLLEEDSFLLERVMGRTTVGDNPLHIAALLGHTDFVSHIINQKPEFAKEFNGQGLLPLHLAAAHGHLAIVQEFLVSQVQDINAKDANGNTVLHLAVARKQFSVIKLLLSSTSVDVNSTNSKGCTPLDLLLESRLEYGDLVIGEMIRAAGGNTTPRPETSQHALGGGNYSNEPLPHRLGSKEDIENANTEPEKETKEKKHNPDILVVVAVLIATITFQAALNSPGGFVPSDADHQDTSGLAVLGSDLTTFLIFDMIGLFLSLCVILLFLCVVPRNRKIVIKFLVWILWLATLSAGLAFTSAISRIFGRSLKKEITILVIGWFVVLLIAALWVTIRLLTFLLKMGITVLFFVGETTISMATTERYS